MLTPFLVPQPLRYTPNIGYYPQNATQAQCDAIDDAYHEYRTAHNAAEDERRNGTLIPAQRRAVDEAYRALCIARGIADCSE